MSILKVVVKVRSKTAIIITSYLDLLYIVLIQYDSTIRLLPNRSLSYQKLPANYENFVA